MRFYYPDTPDLPLPPGHRFPAAKYRLLRERIVRDRLLGAARLVPAPGAGRDELRLAHAEEHIDAVIEGSLDAAAQRRIGLPWSPVLAARARAVVGGAIAAARDALMWGVAGQLSGGTHHAHYGFGAGYCVFNDLAVAALALRNEGRVARIAILDLDVHQGDGTAALLAGKPGMLVASVHGQNNFPFRKVASDIDVALPDGTDDNVYLLALAPVLEQVVAFRPDLVLYLSGADPLAADRLGRLSLTHTGLMQRDRLVFDCCRRHGLPVAIAVGGGYAEPIEATVEGYANTFRAAREVLGF